VWDGDEPSSSESSSSSDEGDAKKETNQKKPKSDLGIRKRLELRFSKKASPPVEEQAKASSPPPADAVPPVAVGERIAPWRSNSSRAEPKVKHGMSAVAFGPESQTQESLLYADY
jgi:hypothetical protein